MFELGERLTRMLDIGVGHRRVLPMMYMPRISSRCTASMISASLRLPDGNCDDISLLAVPILEFEKNCRDIINES
jgi:hypothetical protein